MCEVQMKVCSYIIMNMFKRYMLPPLCIIFRKLRLYGLILRVGTPLLTKRHHHARYMYSEMWALFLQLPMIYLQVFESCNRIVRKVGKVNILDVDRCVAVASN